ncbi:GAF domain-containing protein [uncultured Paraglaciecola sp.]|jgi:GAF domain-containing protein|uniref:GAF domain-containing protein n=1 Tax=uncultured Paraglaciecola sp. TaxID=1765024 RepID=UPI0025D80824|nr:GAF domain-containing protein [uncultured Paraglaciecola sp.]
MKVPIIPDNETERLCSLYNLAILDTAPEQRYDYIPEKVKSYFNVPIALISLVDCERQWFKSSQGLDATETSREISFCGHAINQNGVYMVNDTFEDERFSDNPLVIGEPFIRFYAGAPIKSDEGYSIGTLCIIDTSPRILTENDQVLLREFADMVERELNVPDETRN